MKEPTAWTIHLKKVYAQMKKDNPSTLLKDAMKVAKQSYKK